VTDKCPAGPACSDLSCRKDHQLDPRAQLSMDLRHAADRFAGADIPDLLRRAYAALSHSSIPLPTNAQDAEAMEKLGYRWLAENAPDRLTPDGRMRAASEESAIEIEKKLCAALGKHWEPSGMSVYTLVDEIIARPSIGPADRDEIAKLIGQHFFLFEEVKNIKGTDFAKACRMSADAVREMLFASLTPAATGTGRINLGPGEIIVNGEPLRKP